MPSGVHIACSVPFLSSSFGLRRTVYASPKRNNTQPDLAVGKLLARACPHLTAAETAAYDAPFPDASFKGSVRRFPNLVPDNPDAEGAALSRRARDWFRAEWAGKTFMAVGMKDPTGPAGDGQRRLV
jgi:hypothetical protein